MCCIIKVFQIMIQQTNLTDDIQLKSVGKMADFETLTLCISINSATCVLIFART